MRSASAKRASPPAVKKGVHDRVQHGAGGQAEAAGQVERTGQGGRAEQVAGDGVAGVEPGGDVAAVAGRGAGEGAPRGVLSPGAAHRRRAAEGALPAGGAGAGGELAGQDQRLGEQGGAVRGLEAACFPGDLRRQLRLAAEGGPDGDAGAVARVAARSPSGGAGSVTVTVTCQPSQSRAVASGTVRSSP
jgi:hypothetical protein